MIQDGLHDAATALLQTIVTPAAAHAASGNVMAIVQLLNSAGHTIARGPAAVQRYALNSDEAVPGTQATLRLH
jgi:hypothetical protein